MNPIPARLSAGAAALVAAVDKIIVDETVETIGTAVDPKTHEVKLVLGKAYLGADDEVKAVFLEHEACHVAMHCSDRFYAHVFNGERKPITLETRDKWQTWNVAHDAVIHHRCMDPSLVVERLEIGAVTFDSLKLAPQSCETTYDALMQQGGGSGKGCGRYLTLGDLPEWLAAEVAQAVARSYAAHGSGGATRSFGPHQPPPPSWARALEAWLRKTCRRGRHRKRSWLQINRRNPFVAGLVHLRGESALVLVDVSGSIADSQIRMVCGLVEKYHKSVDVVWWANRASPRRPARLALAMKGDVGGGTNPHPAAALRLPGEPVIWITDSEVPSWPVMTSLDLVLTTGAPAPSPATTVKI